MSIIFSNSVVNFYFRIINVMGPTKRKRKNIALCSSDSDLDDDGGSSSNQQDNVSFLIFIF